MDRIAFLFDHLVGEGEQHGCYGEAKRPGGLKVENERELRRSQNWQLGWIRAAENLAGVVTSLSIPVGDIGAAAYQATSIDEVT